MIKNFRMQLIPLAQTPAVSNVRRYGGRLGWQMPTTTQDLHGGFAPKPPTRQESPQRQDTTNSPATTSVNVAEVNPSDSLYSLQIAPSDSVSNRGDNPDSSPLCSAQITVNDRSSPSTPRAPSVVSEPYWLAMSDYASVCTTLSLPINSPYPSTPTISCRGCLKEFRGNRQDAVANFRRHLRPSARHMPKDLLNCPLPESRTRHSLRLDDSGPDLRAFAEFFSRGS